VAGPPTRRHTALNQAYKDMLGGFAAGKEMGQVGHSTPAISRTHRSNGSPIAMPSTFEDSLAFGGTAIGGNYPSLPVRAELPAN
jgi:hypothetical protein